MCMLLLSAGADIQAQIDASSDREAEHLMGAQPRMFSSGSRPVDIAKSMGHMAVVELLQTWPHKAPARALPPSLSQLRDAGHSLNALHSAGHSLNDLLDAGFSIDQLFDAGLRCGSLRTVARRLRLQGCSMSELRDRAGFGATELLLAGFKACDLRIAGFDIEDLTGAGCDAQQLRAAGYQSCLLRDVGFHDIELAYAGFNSPELRLQHLLLRDARLSNVMDSCVFGKEQGESAYHLKHHKRKQRRTAQQQQLQRKQRQRSRPGEQKHGQIMRKQLCSDTWDLRKLL